MGLGKTYTGRGGDTAHTLLMGEQLGWGHRTTLTEKIYMVGWMGGWVDDSFRKYCHFVAPSCKMELARFSAPLRIQDGAECGNYQDPKSQDKGLTVSRSSEF